MLVSDYLVGVCAWERVYHPIADPFFVPLNERSEGT